MNQCRLCEKSDVPVDHEGICSACRTVHALPPYTPPVRKPRPCPHCNGTVFVRCRVIRERSSTPGDIGVEYIAPLSVTFDTREHITFWASRREQKPDIKAIRGLLEAYICRGCGFTEWFTRGAEHIPIGPQYGTEIIDITSDSPYR